MDGEGSGATSGESYTEIVYTIFVCMLGARNIMRNITLSADENVIEAARERARGEKTTLNEAFRRWLASYAGQRSRALEAKMLIHELRSRVRTGGRKFTRDEMNER